MFIQYALKDMELIMLNTGVAKIKEFDGAKRKTVCLIYIYIYIYMYIYIEWEKMIMTSLTIMINNQVCHLEATNRIEKESNQCQQ